MIVHDIFAEVVVWLLGEETNFSPVYTTPNRCRIRIESESDFLSTGLSKCRLATDRLTLG